MGTRLGKLRAAVADLEEVLNELKDKETITDAEASHIQKLEQLVTKRYESLDDKWDKLEDQDTFKDPAERQKCESDYNEARKINKSILNGARHVLNKPRPGINTLQSTTGAASSGPIKIEDTLKPKELLSEDMNLEEANLWFKAYRAHLSYNKVNMAKQEIQVRRAMLDLCLDSRMASALRAHEKVKDDTEIDATDPKAGCLNILREIFLERNPVWLRRHWYFQCVQAQDETVEQWWNRKQDKGRQCDLEQITAKDIRMLELIRGISSQALRKEFLKQKEPTLDTLIQIAKNWQRSTDVTRNMESSVDSRKTSSSNYQKGKAKEWQSKSGGAPAQDTSGDRTRTKKCMRCGQPPHENRDLCKAKDATCPKCQKKGHFGSVCLSDPKAKNGKGNNTITSKRITVCKRVSYIH